MRHGCSACWHRTVPRPHNDLTKVIQNNKAKLTYTYDDYHNVKTATTEEGLVYTFTYDAYGNNTAVSISGDGSTMTSTAAYSSDGNRLVSTTDALGNVTQYGYDEITNVLEWVQYPEDTEATRTEYTYDSMYRLTTAACTTDTGLEQSARYTYTDDLLTSIQTPSTTYSFTYGNFSLRSSVKAGSYTLATYSYTDDRNNYLSSLDYGNGDSVNYTYDDKGRLLTQTYEDGDNLYYKYDNSGNLASVWDSATETTTKYYYDFTDRMMKYVETGTDYSHSVGYEYDTKNNLTGLTEVIDGVEKNTTYTYDDDNRIKSVTTDGITVTYEYDGFGRVIRQETKNGDTLILTESFTYVNPTATTTSSQIATYTTTGGGYSVTYSYTYDDNGNITSVSDGTNTTTYLYDCANQLYRENNQAGNYTYVWHYDDAGNITKRMRFAYITGGLEDLKGTVNYTYGDSEWGDLLTVYDGDTITYDGIGNMLSDGKWTYTWENGRELASMSDGTTTWTYTYDANGMRTSKTNGTATYSYVYNGSQLSQMTAGSVTLDFTYDANGTPLTVTYNGTTYYYATNLQGDVTSILDASGNAVVIYTYDAWGTLRTIGGSIKPLCFYNPLRYRGYVYDQETGLYYLQSRYYDPELGRFINADGLVSTGQGLLGNNMFAYCGNNPVDNIDPTGTCYYNAGGKWCHDNWEYIGGYQRKPDPGYYAGTSNSGIAVYIAPTEDYSTPPNSIKAIDMRDTHIDAETGEHDPDIKIINSYKITNTNEITSIAKILLKYDKENPSVYTWERSLNSLIVEWDAHNDIYRAYPNERCQHVDFNKNDEGVTLGGFWKRAITEKLKEWWNVIF